MISLKAVRFGFPGSEVLFDKFDLEFAKGQTTALLGPSGCGKSTVVRLVCGLLRPQSGSVMVDRNIAQPGRIRGVLFQEDTLVPWKSAIQNALFPKTAGPHATNDRAERLLERVGLSGARSLLPHELSAGMKKRLEFVRATLNDGNFVIADEPFTGLDYHQRRVLWGIWADVVKSDRTGVLVTHDIEEALALADRVIVFAGSKPTRIVFDTVITQTMEKGALAEALRNALISNNGQAGLPR